MSGLYSQGQMPSERDTTMRDLLAVVFKRKWLILTFFIVTSVIVGLKVLTTPETFTADATLMIQRNARTSALERNTRALPWVEVIESELQIARSVPVVKIAQARLLEATDKHPEGIKIPVASLTQQINTGSVGESNVIAVSGTAGDYDVAIRIANTVAQAYVDYHKQLFALPDASGFIRQKADSTYRALESLQEQRHILLAQVGVNDLDEEEKNLLRLRFDARTRLSASELRATKLRTELESIPKDLDENLEALPFNNPMGYAQGNAMFNAIIDLRRKMRELDDLRTRYTDSHPQVREVMKEVEMEREGLRASIQQVVTLKEQEFKVAQAEVADLRGQLREIEDGLATLPAIIERVSGLNTRIESMRKQYSSLAEQAVDTSVLTASFQEFGVHVLSPAVTARRNKKGDMVRVALAPLLSLLAGVGLAFYLENMDHSMKTREDVERHLEIPVLASFPDVDQGDTGIESRARRTPFGGKQAG